MKIGLEKLEDGNNMPIDDNTDIGLLLLDIELMGNIIDSQIDKIDSKEDCLQNLKSIRSAISSNKTKNVALETLLLSDKEFVEMFGSVSSKWNDRIAKLLTKEEAVSTEGMKLQDFLRWGPNGVLIGKYLSSVRRVIPKLQNNLLRYRNSPEHAQIYIQKYSSVYLPSPTETTQIIEGIKKLQGCITTIMSKKGKVSVDELRKILNGLGIAPGQKNINIKTDWSVIGGSFVGGLILSALSVPILGNVVGKQIFSSKGLPVARRGWTVPLLEKATKETIDIFSQTKVIEQQMKVIYTGQISVGPGAADGATIGFLLRASFKNYRRLMAVLGRGLAAINL